MKLHYGYSRSKNYGKAVSLSSLVINHEIRGQGINQWHIVEFDESSEFQLNLAANIYRLTVGFRYPKYYGRNLHRLYNCASNDGRYIKRTNYRYATNGKQEEKTLHTLASKHQKTFTDIAIELKEIIDVINSDLVKAKELLEGYGYIETSHDGMLTSFTSKVKEVSSPMYEVIQDLVKNKNYKEAISEYYRNFGDRLIKNDIYSNELIYLKREAGVELSGLELVALYGNSGSNELVSKHRERFIEIVDRQINLRKKKGLPTPLDILNSQVPTINEMVEERQNDWRSRVYFSDGKVKKGEDKVTINNFSVEYDKCLRGNIYPIFPDPVRQCEVIDISESKKYWSLWTPISQKDYVNKVTKKGLRLGFIDCLHPSEKGYRLIKGDGINDYMSEDQVVLSPVAGEGVMYTGATHKIGPTKYFEINVIRNDPDKAKKIGNVFLELCEEILRDTENELRVSLGLPRIGEGWISEMEMFNLIKMHFKDAKHHARPLWLKPQHLDVYIESQGIAFEYQGRQHYEPVEYFGGQESFKNTQVLDKRKKNLCKRNNVQLLYWKYDEPITKSLLLKKLEKTKT